MKGLLIKDLKLLKNQRVFFLTVILVTLVFVNSPEQGGSFAVGYLTFVSSLFVLSTMSYDETDNGLSFLFTLPFTRKIYVYEKYIFGLMIGGTAWLLSSTAAFIHDYHTLPLLNITDWWLSYILILIILFIIISFAIPLRLKFGNDKSRIFVAILCGGTFAIAFIIAQAGKHMGIDIEQILESFIFTKLLSSVGTLLAVSFIILGISIVVSLKILNHKEL